MNIQDWKPIIFTKKINTNTNKNQKNKNNTFNGNHKLAKLDRTEIGIIKKIPLKMSKCISKQRNLLKISQKDLAKMVNIKTEVICQYENGKAIPNQSIINKLEKILGIYLRGEKMGEKK